MSSCRVIAAIVLAAPLFSVSVAEACTRILYQAGDGAYITGRNMDWAENSRTNLWVFPRGLEREGSVAENPLRWTSRYGSVISAFYDVASVDGMNEKGLLANGLYLTVADYGEEQRRHLPGLTIGEYMQYVLESFASVEEAVTELGKDRLRIVAPVFPNGKAGTGHLSLSDASGDSAILEYVNGELQVHHSPDYKVMTNDPPYEQQLAISAYWEQIGGMTMLPGTNRPADRFVRASFFVNATPAFDDRSQAIAAVFSMMRAVSVPLGITDPDHPHISATIWRTVADHSELRYFFESSHTPNVFWVDLAKLDLAEGSPVRKLDLHTGNPIHAGEVSAAFVEADAFRFMREAE